MRSPRRRPPRLHKKPADRTRREKLAWLEQAFERGQAQLNLARAVQQRLLPPPAVEVHGLEVAARFLPSAAISGDFWDCFSLGSTHLGLYLGDVEGKGLEAAMYALLVSGIMRGLHKTDRAPDEVVHLLNQRLLERTLPGKFCCFAYALFDLQQGRLGFANAGLPRPWLLRSGAVQRLPAHGFPVGIFDDCEANNTDISLRPGDCLVFYTDGLPDSLQFLRRRRGDGETQLERILRSVPQESAVALTEGLATHLERARRGRPLHDDATVLVVRVLEPR